MSPWDLLVLIGRINVAAKKGTKRVMAAWLLINGRSSVFAVSYVACKRAIVTYIAKEVRRIAVIEIPPNKGG